MSKSRQTIVVSGGSPLLTFSLPYIEREHLSFWVNGEQRQVEWVNDGAVNLVLPVPDGTEVLVQRNTPTTPLVNFTNGAGLSAEEFDLAFLQALYVSEESLDLVSDLKAVDFAAVVRDAENAAEAAEAQAVTAATRADAAGASAIAAQDAAAAIETRATDSVYLIDTVPLTLANGVTDVSAAVQAALDQGKKVYIPFTVAPFHLGNATLDFSAGGSLVGLDSAPANLSTNATVFMNEEGLSDVVLMENINLRGPHNGSSYQIRLLDCHRVGFRNVNMSDVNSGIDIRGGSKITIDHCSGTEVRGTFIKLRDGVEDVHINALYTRNVRNFSIYGDVSTVPGGASSRGVVITDLVREFSPGDLIPGKHDVLLSEVSDGRLGNEAIGARWDTREWKIRGGRISKIHENGISLSGDEHTCSGVTMDDCSNVGIIAYGENNIIEGNFVSGCLYNFGVSPSAGGLARRNIIANNISNSARSGVGVLLNPSQYVPYSHGGSVSAGYCTNVVGGQTVIYDLISTSSGVHGPTPPTHLSGDATVDGNVWRFVVAIPSDQSLEPRGTTVTGNVLNGDTIGDSAISATTRSQCLLGPNNYVRTDTDELNFDRLGLASIPARYDARTDKAVSGGAMTVDQGYIRVTTNTDLTTLNTNTPGLLVHLTAQSGTFTVRHSSSLRLNGGVDQVVRAGQGGITLVNLPGTAVWDQV